MGAGVEDDHASPAFWSPVSETGWLERRARRPIRISRFDRAKPGLIAVNAAGRRFVDEAVSYHEFVVGMHRSHEAVPTIPAWLVCDRPFVERYGLGRVPPGRRSWRKLIASGYLVEADTLDALAAKIKVDAAGSARLHHVGRLGASRAAVGRGAMRVGEHAGDRDVQRRCGADAGDRADVDHRRHGAAKRHVGAEVAEAADPYAEEFPVPIERQCRIDDVVAGVVVADMRLVSKSRAI